MNNDVLLGSYVPLNSLIHRLDPRAKLFFCFLFVIDCFIVDEFYTGLALMIILLLIMAASRVAIRSYWGGVKPFVWVILITVAFQLLFSSGGQVYWHAGAMAITIDGLVNAVYIIFRFLMTILAATVLTATTSSFAISRALTWFLRPLAKLHLPIDQFSLMMGIALQFIPILNLEYHNIIDAQKSRGANFDGGSWRHPKELMPLLVPLLVSTFNRAQDIATAMEARGYVPGRRRTNYHHLTWRITDTLATVMVVVITAAVIAIQYLM